VDAVDTDTSHCVTSDVPAPRVTQPLSLLLSASTAEPVDKFVSNVLPLIHLHHEFCLILVTKFIHLVSTKKLHSFFSASLFLFNISFNSLLLHDFHQGRAGPVRLLVTTISSF